jgi:hypothetical protein
MATAGVMPDLLIKNIKQFTGKPKVGQSVQFAVTVKNDGVSVAPAYRIILRIGGGRQLAEKQATRLGPDREATYTVVLPPRQAANAIAWWCRWCRDCGRMSFRPATTRRYTISSSGPSANHCLMRVKELSRPLIIVFG